jgi:hypothetical protein
VSATALPLNLVVKLSAVAANGRSTLITTGWAALSATARGMVPVKLRATAYRLMPGERLRVAVACADFPRVWPTPLAAVLRVFHGASLVRLPVCPAPVEDLRPVWGKLQPEVLGSANDLGGGQSWDLTRDLMTDTVRLSATKSERTRVDGVSAAAAEHEYGAAVSAARPDLARMHSTTTVTVERPVGRTVLVARTVTTAHSTAVEVDIAVDGQPYWKRNWLIRPPAA